MNKTFKTNKATVSLRKKYPYLEFFWSIFSRIWTEYGEMQSISPYSERMQENTDQKNSVYGYFSRSVIIKGFYLTEPHSELQKMSVWYT